MDFESGFSFPRIQYSWRFVTFPAISNYLEKCFGFFFLSLQLSSINSSSFKYKQPSQIPVSL